MTTAIRVDAFKAHGSKEVECNRSRGWIGTKKYKGSTGPGCRRSTASKAAKARRAKNEVLASEGKDLIKEPIAFKAGQKKRAEELAARIRAKKAPALEKGKARRSRNEARAAEKKARIMGRMADRKKKPLAIPRAGKDFKDWAGSTKKMIEDRAAKAREGSQKTIAERQMAYYQSPAEYLAGELQGYTTSRNGEVKNLRLPASITKTGAVRRLSVDDAIKESQRLFAEHQDRWTKVLG